MMNGVELVVHYRDTAGAPVCARYVGRRLANPVLIVLADTGAPASRADQSTLWHALDAEITGPFGGRAVTPPCGGSPSFSGCHARGDAACQKLLILILIGDGHSPPSPAVTALCDGWANGGPGHATVPVFPIAARTSVSRCIPASVQASNAAFWQHSLCEALPAIFARARITAEQPHLFISYRQIDSAALAIQLFDALSHAGFDVFLDHFRIPPGINFQARLTQELYRVWLTSRPPEGTDFHRARGSTASRMVGVVIGLSQLMEPARADRTAWLAEREAAHD